MGKRRETFHRLAALSLAAAMAGAISAGAYSAGVMDFIIEALEEYQAAKAAPDWNGPTHDVRILVLAGASVLAGLLAEAAEVCATARCLVPNFTIAGYRAEAISTIRCTSRSVSISIRVCV